MAKEGRIAYRRTGPPLAPASGRVTRFIPGAISESMTNARILAKRDGVGIEVALQRLRDRNRVLSQTSAWVLGAKRLIDLARAGWGVRLYGHRSSSGGQQFRNGGGSPRCCLAWCLVEITPPSTTECPRPAPWGPYRLSKQDQWAFRDGLLAA